MEFKNEKVTLDKIVILISKTVIIYFLFIVLIFAVPIYLEVRASIGTVFDKYTSTRFVVGETAMTVEVVTDLPDRVRGLSGRLELAADTGMFFIFDAPDFHGIWMKDMNFPIDIIWFDEFLQVVYIEENVSPESYPRSFAPNKKSLYVLEVNAGFVKKEGIKIGDQGTIR